MKFGDWLERDRKLVAEQEISTVVPIIEKVPEIIQESSPVSNNTDEYYWNMKTPKGVRYNIPLLDASKPDYKRKYIEYMKIKEQKPRVFDKIMSWE